MQGKLANWREELVELVVGMGLNLSTCNCKSWHGPGNTSHQGHYFGFWLVPARHASRANAMIIIFYIVPSYLAVDIVLSWSNL